MTSNVILNPVVAVPVHRPHPTPDECFGLQRCGQVLANHPIRIVHPLGLNLDAYKDLLPTAIPLPVPPGWMSSIRAYNRMMINPAFYHKFIPFSHILVHEPDALVISDQLLYWCRQPFDFIGAPWFEGFDRATPDAPIIGVGNSGFSLINIVAMLDFLNSKQRWISRRFIVNDILSKIFLRRSRYSLRFLLDTLGSSGKLAGAHKYVDDQCDLFLAAHAPSSLLRIADHAAALRFAWEVNPDKCFQLSGYTQPFGIHAWARYRRTFIVGMLNNLDGAPCP